MDLSTSVALVTGANRGLGRAFTAELLERGAKVYAGARNPSAVDLPDAVPVELDITDPASVERAAKAAPDVTLLINNAGSSTGQSLVDGDLDGIRVEMETHYFGTLGMIRAFAPLIETNGGGAILNVLSALSWLHPSAAGAYSAAKAASWALTNAVREELAPRGIAVSAVLMAHMDTDMAAHIAEQKIDPAIVAALALDGIASGANEILADDLTRRVKAALTA